MWNIFVIQFFFCPLEGDLSRDANVTMATTNCKHQAKDEKDV